MNKDVIYVDVDDDVTAIIGKIKNAKEKIVAVVPPKRAGVLQSAVNLRLLDRMARTEKKQLVLITANQALVALAASAAIPVAKNLQTKPEIAEMENDAEQEFDDVIDGSELPVGDHAKSVSKQASVEEPQRPTRVDDTIDMSGLNLDGEDVAIKREEPKRQPKQAATGGGRKSPKIPNFDTFRKKLVWIISGGVALVALLIWMFAFAPAATIIITAQTSKEPINATVRLGGTEQSDVEAGVLSSNLQSEDIESTVEFQATGEKDVGERATGTITITNCDGPGFTISADTPFTASNGKVYYSTTSANVSEQTGRPSECRSNGSGAGSGSVSVRAADSGESYNIGSADYVISGVGGDVYARGSAMTGGSTKVVKVVTAADVEKARSGLSEKSENEQKDALRKKFSSDQVVIEDSFSSDKGEVIPVPAVGNEVANGRAKLTVKTTVSMQAVEKKALDDFLKKSLEANLDDKNNQKVYGTGVDDAKFTGFQKSGDSSSVTLSSEGRVGPKIDEDKIKENAKGQGYGEIQQGIKALEGVQDVDVKFSFFWVNKAPKNTDKIKIEFKVKENGDE